MADMQSFRVFLNMRLIEAATDILGAVERTIEDYQGENGRLRRILHIKPEMEPCQIDSLRFSLTEEEVPPEQQNCEQEWSSSLGQEDPEPTQIKEEQEELRTSQEEELNHRLLENKDSILTPSCVKRECDQEYGPSTETSAEYPSVNGLKMSKLQLLQEFINESLMVSAAEEIFRAVKKTLAEYRKENDQLRGMLELTPETQSCSKDTQSFSVSKDEFHPEQQPCEQAWSPIMCQEDPEPTEIKEEQEELRTSQEEELNHRLLENKDSILTPPCVKRERDQDDPFVGNRESDFPLWSSNLPCPFCVEKTFTECKEENDRLRRQITPDTIDSLRFSLSEEEVPPEQQNCEQEWSTRLGQEDQEPTEIKEEQEELRTSQEEELNHRLLENKDSILTPSCVKRERDQEYGPSTETSAEYPSVNGLKMSKLQLLQEFINEILMVSAAVEIFREVEEIVADYVEDDQLQRLLTSQQCH
ncbi:hypothetical protein DPEC_G00105850 [Dallia pectoralis]|uniref:Uncharacterized protein n=1 Tax=Dallia pectoralis TaxID=75939 RepID=A0ACC2GYE0_DALPE|nr:hypothetical protein DPEC_G00105850 [Dallia pectoralis]